jgi:hypothetical protein
VSRLSAGMTHVNNFALGTLRKGYVIPFLENPAKMFKKNNRSAMKNAEFVDQTVNELTNFFPKFNILG